MCIIFCFVTWKLVEDEFRLVNNQKFDKKMERNVPYPCKITFMLCTIPSLGRSSEGDTVFQATLFRHRHSRAIHQGLFPLRRSFGRWLLGGMFTGSGSKVWSCWPSQGDPVPSKHRVQHTAKINSLVPKVSLLAKAPELLSKGVHIP